MASSLLARAASPCKRKSRHIDCSDDPDALAPASNSTPDECSGSADDADGGIASRLDAFRTFDFDRLSALRIGDRVHPDWAPIGARTIGERVYVTGLGPIVPIAEIADWPFAASLDVVGSDPADELLDRTTLLPSSDNGLTTSEPESRNDGDSACLGSGPGVPDGSRTKQAEQLRPYGPVFSPGDVATARQIRKSLARSTDRDAAGRPFLCDPSRDTSGIDHVVPAL